MTFCFYNVVSSFDVTEFSPSLSINAIWMRDKTADFQNATNISDFQNRAKAHYEYKAKQSLVKTGTFYMPKACMLVNCL